MVRFKNRWLLFELVYDGDVVVESVSSGNLAQVIRDSVQSNFGDLGAAQIAASFSIKYWSSRTGHGIIRVERDLCRMLWCAITMVTEVKGRAALIRVLHCGGTVKKTQEAAVEENRKALVEMGRKGSLSDSDIAALHLKTKADIMAITEA
ncbi:hypothetical protein HK101_004810 [Irineochytrium annulatum]|nr:hypothetical protein HK101_004810 [Irineochytrium annulatum]